MDGRKHIGIVIQNLTDGGAQRVAANLSLYLCEKYHVHLIVFDGQRITFPCGGNLHDLKLPPRRGLLRKLLNILRRARAVKRIKRTCSISATISLMDGANLVNVLSRCGDKIIISVRNVMSKVEYRTALSRALNRRLLRWTGKKADCVVAVSRGVEGDLAEAFGMDSQKIITIYNPCDGGALKERARKRLGDAAAMADLGVATMGRLDEQKGQWHLIRAFSEVVKACPQAKLYLLGEGPLRPRLENLASGLGLAKSVVFLGYLEAPHAYIMRSKAFVLPSLYEGMSNALLEAMACGTPCVATDHLSGAREIMAPGTKVRQQLESVEYAEYGILTSVGGYGEFDAESALTKDELQLSEAITRLLTDETLRARYAEKALARSRDFQPEAVMPQWEALL